ncbi:MAG: VanZ family protein [Clostridia bacterium]|nr:VanZ family protein [Clostridia bacterium]
MNKKLKTIATIFFTCCYIFCVGLLVWQALTPGSESSNISQNFGDQLNNALTNIITPVTKKVDVSSVEISSVKVNGEGLEIESDDGENYDYVEIALGSSVKISTTVLPSNASNPSVEYSLSNSEVATISQGGELSTLSEGECLLTVVSKDNQTVSHSILLKINRVNAESIEITNKEENLYVGQTHVIKVAFTPANATNKKVVWSVSDQSVLSISESGKIEALAVGSATVYAKWEDDQTILDSFTVEVKGKPEVSDIELTDIIIDCASTITLRCGDKQTIGVTFAPENATYKGLNYFSSNEKVATVSKNGEIEALTTGECIITVSSNTYPISKQITLTVTERLTEKIVLSISGASGENNVIKVGSSATLKATIDEKATIKTVVYQSSNTKVATVSQDGVVKAIGAGKATITVISSYGNESVSQSIEITVERVAFKDTIKNFYHWVRKAFGHFGAFLVLGGAASLMFLCFSKKGIKSKIIMFVVCMVSGFAVAGLTEIFQLPIFTQGRFCSFTDVLIDFTGYTTSTVAIFLIVFIYEIIKIIRFKRMQSKNKN